MPYIAAWLPKVLEIQIRTPERPCSATLHSYHTTVRRYCRLYIAMKRVIKQKHGQSSDCLSAVDWTCFSRWGGGIADITGDKRSNSIVGEKGRNYWFGLVYFSVVLDEFISAGSLCTSYSVQYRYKWCCYIHGCLNWP